MTIARPNCKGSLGVSKRRPFSASLPHHFELAGCTAAVEAEIVSVVASLAFFGLHDLVAAPWTQLAIFGAGAVRAGVHAVITGLVSRLHDRVSTRRARLTIGRALTVVAR